MPTTLQKVMIGEELLTAVRLLKTGLRELNRMTGATDFFHLPILLLASGFERLMKTVICCHHLKETGEFPNRDAFPKGKHGHDLVWLLDQITEHCFPASYVARIPAARVDISLLQSDGKLRRIVKILSEFGQSARYYNLNVVLGSRNPGPSPDDEWQKLEMEILREDPAWMQRIAEPSQNGPVHETINAELTVHCERLARSLCRLFTIGGLGELAKQVSCHTHHFLCLMDDELGKTDYENIQV